MHTWKIKVGKKGNSRKTWKIRKQKLKETKVKSEPLQPEGNEMEMESKDNQRGRKGRKGRQEQNNKNKKESSRSANIHNNKFMKLI